MIDDLIGLRDADLSADERARVRDDPRHHDALALGRRLAALPAPRGGPGAAVVLARARRRRWPVAAALVAAAACAALMLRADPDGTQLRGVDAPLGDVHLSVVVERPGGLTALTPGETLGADAQVVFRVQTSAGGHLVVSSGEGRVWPPDGQAWIVDAGVHVPGGASPLAYRPDAPTSGPIRYEASLCPGPDRGDPRCARDAVTVRWGP